MEIQSGYAQSEANIQLYYECWGHSDHPALLMIMGLGAQMTVWPQRLLEALVEAGHYVVVFDNRDIGLSTATPEVQSRTMRNYIRSKLGCRVKAPYNLSDMAGDAVAVLNHLGIEKAHVVGASMGGMIAQLLAVEHPSRVASIVGVMTSPNENDLPRPPLKLLMQLTGLRGEPIVDADSAARNRIQLWRMINSPEFLTDEDVVYSRAAASYTRSFRPQGAAKHSMAVMATGGFEDRLKAVKVPSLFIHGSADRLVHSDGGRRSARAIPGARFELIQGMGHEIPDALCEFVAAKIAQHIATISE